MFVQNLRSTNDVNGNPRRLWATYDNLGHVVAIDDEGYQGRPQSLRTGDAIELMSVVIPPAEYRRLLKYGRGIAEGMMEQ